MPASALRLAVCPLDVLPSLTAAHDDMDFVHRIDRQTGGCERRREPSPWGSDRGSLLFRHKNKLGRAMAARSRVPDCRTLGPEQRIVLESASVI